MKEIIILTPTFNHPKHLEKLYESLKKQTYKEFTWLIIDDGSNEKTLTIVKKIQKEEILDIEYIYQDNQGKSSAINRGIDEVLDSKFLLIVDDDENLFSNALTIVKEYMEKYKDTECGVIDFLRSFKNKENKEISQNEYFMTLQERKNKKIDSDGYTGYFIEALKDNRFPIFKNEKYIGPSVLLMLVSRKWKVLWSNKTLGETEYLLNGLTFQGRNLRIKNPKGMIYYCMLLQEQEANILTRLKYSILAYAYLNFSNLKKEELIEDKINFKKFISYTNIFGKMLSCYWRIKYGTLCR